MTGARGERRGRWLPSVLVVTVVLLVAARVWLAAAYDVPGVNNAPLADNIAILLAFCAYFVVGVVLVARRPDNRLGWVLTGIGVLTCVGVLAEAYAVIALTDRTTPLPGGVLAAWIHNWYWYPLLGLIFLFVPMLFPTGRPLTPRWRWLYRSGTALFVFVTVISWVKPVLTDSNLNDPAYAVPNPIGVPAVGDIESSPLGSVAFVLLLALSLAAIASLVVRFRRSRGLERQQMKLFMFAVALVPLMSLIEELGLDRFLPDSNVVFGVAVALPPVAIGVAVMRYRLYEIDRIISRTVTYVLLTALLVGVYLAAVTALTALTAPVTRDSPIAVAAATLIAATAFQPARRRIQSAVDRRFNRARYDAARTVDEYRARLRDELDLAAITLDLQRAVDAAVQPARSTVWLRPETGR